MRLTGHSKKTNSLTIDTLDGEGKYKKAAGEKGQGAEESHEEPGKRDQRHKAKSDRTRSPGAL